MSNNASSTSYTYLIYKASGSSSFTKLCSIKDFPDLGGSPDQIDVTDLDDDVQKFILGVQSMSAMEFTANYDMATFKLLDGLATGELYDFGVSFGNKTDADAYGIFTWKGQLAVWATGGSVNNPREMKISISATTKVKLDETATFTLSGS